MCVIPRYMCSCSDTYYICDASMCINLLIILILFLKVFLTSSLVSIPYISRRCNEFTQVATDKENYIRTHYKEGN